MSVEPTDELHFLGQSPVVWFLKVQFLKSGCSIHWFLKYEKVPRAKRGLAVPVRGKWRGCAERGSFSKKVG